MTTAENMRVMAILISCEKGGNKELADKVRAEFSQKGGEIREIDDEKK